MDWESLRQSGNVEDRRGFGPGGLVVGGGGIAIVIALVSLLFGANPSDVLSNLTGGGQQGQPYQSTPQNDQNADFASRILGDTEDVWSAIFQKMGRTYTPTPLVLYSGSYPGGCGTASAATGPFYCPEDQKVYLDLSFFDELQNQFGASGDFARAYVIAHEVGHHVQQELGIEPRVRAQQQQTDQVGANALSVRLELQADCFAGVWGHYTQQRGVINQADVKDALNAAAAIGDDRLSRGQASPDSFTHGTSAQRVAWFSRGLKSGNIQDCDTFNQ